MFGFCAILGHLGGGGAGFLGFLRKKWGKCGKIGVVGSVAEWLKAHAWKACERGDSFRRFESSRFRQILCKFVFFLVRSIIDSASLEENTNLL